VSVNLAEPRFVDYRIKMLTK